MMSEEKNKDLFEAIGKKYGVPAKEVRGDIEQLIVKIWNDPDMKENFALKDQFGDGVPDVEEFVYKIAKAIKEQKDDEDKQ